MKTNTDLLLNFIFTIAFTVLIFAVLKLSKDNKTVRAEINELRELFNQKFLQEMIVSEPEIRDLTYRKVGSTKKIQKFEF
jgi:hypothetical protein